MTALRGMDGAGEVPTGGPAWSIVTGEGPLVATAIHSGHALREELGDLLALGDGERLREEDPFTEAWTAVAPTRVVVHRSRFEVDLNRPRERAVYLRPDDAWGLKMWKKPLGRKTIDRSLRLYDSFYAELKKLLARKEKDHGRFVLFDLHSYNHRRGGPGEAPAAPEGNPEVNVGTGNLDREYWAPVVDSFLAALRRFDFAGRRLDVRENVKFRGGHLSRWVGDNFPRSGCTLAIEFKKFFMDEWSGEPFADAIETSRRALASTVAPVLDALSGREPGR